MLQPLPLLRRSKVQAGQFDEPVSRIAEYLAGPVIEIDDPAILNDGQTIPDVVRNSPVPLLALLQLLLGTLPFGDVSQKPQEGLSSLLWANLIR